MDGLDDLGCATCGHTWVARGSRAGALAYAMAQAPLTGRTPTPPALTRAEASGIAAADAARGVATGDVTPTQASRRRDRGPRTRPRASAAAGASPPPDPNRCQWPTCNKTIDRSRKGTTHQRFCCDAHRRKWHHQHDKEKWIAHGMALARPRGA